MSAASTSAGAWRVTATGPRWIPSSLPSVVSAGSVRVAVDFAGICGSDFAKFLQHPTPVPPEGVWQPGHEIVGRIEGAAGHVVVNPLQPCRSCPVCAQGAIHLCARLKRIGWDLPGGFADLVDVPASAVVALPEDVAPIHAVIADAMAVAIHGLRCCAAPFGRAPGRLAVIGSGQIAICTAVIALAFGWTVTLLARAPEKLELLRGLLPVAIGNSTVTSASTYDCVVDAAAGHSAAPLETALRIVRDGGQVIVQNAYNSGIRLGTDLRNIFRRSITITGAFSYCRRGGDDFALAIEHLRGAPAWLDALTAHRLPMTALPKAIAAAETGRAPVKTILTTEGKATP